MKEKTCCFTGHRPATLPWGSREGDPRCAMAKSKIRSEIILAIADGFSHFICGMAQGGDLYFGELVADLKASFPSITLEAAIPFPQQAQRWSLPQQQRYQALLGRCDKQTIVSPFYAPHVLHMRNRYMVDHASRIIALYNGSGGGTGYTVSYAANRELDIHIIEP